MRNRDNQSRINIIEMVNMQKSRLERLGGRERDCSRLGVQTIEDLRLDHMLNSFSVPPVPPGFVSRVLAEARNRSLTRQPVRTQRWWSKNYWVAWYSPAHAAACLAVVVACAVGLALNYEIGKADRQAPILASATALHGLEWLNAATPGAVTSAYVAMGRGLPKFEDML